MMLYNLILKESGNYNFVQNAEHFLTVFFVVCLFFVLADRPFW